MHLSVQYTSTGCSVDEDQLLPYKERTNITVTIRDD